MKKKTGSKQDVKSIKPRKKSLKDHVDLIIMAADADDSDLERLLDQVEELRRSEGDPEEVRKERHSKLITKLYEENLKFLIKNSGDELEQIEMDILYFKIFSACFYEKYGQNNWVSINEVVFENQSEKN